MCMYPNCCIKRVGLNITSLTIIISWWVYSNAKHIQKSEDTKLTYILFGDFCHCNNRKLTWTNRFFSLYFSGKIQPNNLHLHRKIIKQLVFYNQMCYCQLCPARATSLSLKTRQSEAIRDYISKTCKLV